MIRVLHATETWPGLSRSRAGAGLCGLLLSWAAATPDALAQLPVLRPGGASGAGAAQTNLSADVQDAAAAVRLIETKLAEARANLATALAMGDAGLTNAPQGVSRQDITTRRALLHRLTRLYEQQLSNAAELETTKRRRAELAQEAQAWNRFAEPPPYSILLADRLRGELQAERLKLAHGEAAQSTMDQLIGENRADLVQAEERIRQLNEQLEGVNDPALAARRSWQRELERLRSHVAVASVALLESERLLRGERLGESRLRVGLLQRQLLLAEAGASFTQADLEQATARVERARLELERELAEAGLGRSTALQALEAARQDLRAPAQPGTAPAAMNRAAALVEARQAQLEAADTAIHVLRLMLEGGNIERTMWELRYAAYNSRDAGILRESEHRLDIFVRRLDLWRDYHRQQLDISSSQLELQQTRVNDLAADPALLPLARERLAALRQRDQMLLRMVRTIEQVQRLSERWAEGLTLAQGRLPFFARVQNLFSGTRSITGKFWSFELFSAEDTITVEGQKITGRRGVTVGKVVMAVLILVVGYWGTGLIALFAEPFIIRRLKIEANQANLIRRWLRALLLVCLVLFSLVSVKIPLTVFAFLGGALAIGLGFGTQTILKNFVSGLILLFERPFRVGDVLDVAGQRGTVTGIGLRSCVLQLWDGTETLIPNSSLLENNVTNWTYSNRRVRFSVAMGVAYGSDPRLVLRLLSEVADRHGLVEKEPKPQALFTDFGESALTFELRFWVDVLKANAAQVASDLRQMIAGALAENGIVMAFPQRELHLDAARPLPVEIVQGPSQPPARHPDGNQPGGSHSREGSAESRHPG